MESVNPKIGKREIFFVTRNVHWRVLRMVYAIEEVVDVLENERLGESVGHEEFLEKFDFLVKVYVSGAKMVGSVDKGSASIHFVDERAIT